MSLPPMLSLSIGYTPTQNSSTYSTGRQPDEFLAVGPLKPFYLIVSNRPCVYFLDSEILINACIFICFYELFKSLQFGIFAARL